MKICVYEARPDERAGLLATEHQRFVDPVFVFSFPVEGQTLHVAILVGRKNGRLVRNVVLVENLLYLGLFQTFFLFTHE